LQMVMITFDDAITATTYDAVAAILDYGHKNPNGCGIRTTWFVSWNYTQCDLASDYYNQGQELADHTVDHFSLPGIDEIENLRTKLSSCTSVPEDNIKGFRTPFLAYAPQTFQALNMLNFTYDCSATEGTPDHATALGGKHWPYTMDAGFGGTCWTGVCDYTQRYPGLWSIPMNTVDEIDTTSAFFARPVGTMDPALSTPDLEKYYKANFLANYNGNRAPFGIWLHPAYLIGDATRVTWLNNFIEEVLALDDVWVVSGADVISYMKAPVAKGSKAPPFSCPPVGYARPLPPATTGTYSPPQPASQPPQSPTGTNPKPCTEPCSVPTGEDATSDGTLLIPYILQLLFLAFISIAY